MATLVKIGSKFINIDLIAYVDIEEMTIYLNSYDGLTGVYFEDDDFDDEDAFEAALTIAFNNYERGNRIFS